VAVDAAHGRLCAVVSDAGTISLAASPARGHGNTECLHGGGTRTRGESGRIVESVQGGAHRGSGREASWARSVHRGSLERRGSFNVAARTVVVARQARLFVCEAWHA
jgi:hypothetical protein